jgi:hypothetical protein
VCAAFLLFSTSTCFNVSGMRLLTFSLAIGMLSFGVLSSQILVPSSFLLPFSSLSLGDHRPESGPAAPGAASIKICLFLLDVIHSDVEGTI